MILTVNYENGRVQQIPFEAPALLSDLLRAGGVPFAMPCGGQQKCMKCKIRASGALEPPSVKEAAFLTADEREAGIRFACMARAVGDAAVSLGRSGGEEIQVEGESVSFVLEPWGEGCGICVDIGTTTVAVYLYDLQSGALLDTASMHNPQAAFGADVISRLEQSLAGQGDALAGVIREGISELSLSLCKAHGTAPDTISSMVLTGNTAMLYLLCGQNPKEITAAPFTLDHPFGEELSASCLALPFENARVFLPPCISAYVGADITTALIASGFYEAGRVPDGAPRLIVDIGTNGEMALASGGTLTCCSTAAGPAFEGAGIYQGMNAQTGAVSAVRYRDGAFAVSVIGGGEAKGLCGSGIIDAVAALLDAGVVDETGLIQEEGHAFSAYLTEADGQTAFRLPGTQVVVTQKDLRAVQLAKSAICAGMQALMAQAGLAPDDVASLVIAGGFGSKIDVCSAERIGLIPKGFGEKARAVGNAAGAGASMLLRSRTMRDDALCIRQTAQTVELSTDPVFMDAYIEGMMFA